MTRNTISAIRAAMVVVVGLVATACGATSPSDLAGLAGQPPLEYSVVVTGGAFVSAPAEAEGELARTWPTDHIEAEGLDLQTIVDALRRARVFTRVESDPTSSVERRQKAAVVGDQVPLRDDALRSILDRADADGHDYLLIVQRLQDGPVEEFGINGRWPLTVALWLVVGLGMLIPDHTYESQARLQVAVFEVQTGRRVYRTVESGGPVELALVDRGDALGLVTSIIVPPFWVPSDDERVVREVRYVETRRLLFSLARQLKSVSCRQELEDRAGAVLRLTRSDGGLRLDVDSRRKVVDVAVRVDGQPVEGAAIERFRERLLRSADTPGDDGRFVHSAVLAAPVDGLRVQVLVRSADGGVASATFGLEDS